MPTLLTTTYVEMFVFGYMRILCKKLRIHLPRSIQRVCLLMYSNMDHWNTNISNELIKGFEFKQYDGVLKLARNNTGNWLNAFGTDTVSKGQHKIWTLLIKPRKQTTGFQIKAAIMIGIIDCDVLHLNHRLTNHFAKQPNGYAYYSNDGNKYHFGLNEYFGTQWNRGNIITMKLDMTQNIRKHGILQYEINWRDQGVAFYSIDINKTYCLAVALLFPNDEIQIIHPTNKDMKMQDKLIGFYRTSKPQKNLLLS
eukprot:30638_1